MNLRLIGIETFAASTSEGRPFLLVKENPNKTALPSANLQKSLRPSHSSCFLMILDKIFKMPHARLKRRTMKMKRMDKFELRIGLTM